MSSMSSVQCTKEVPNQVWSHYRRGVFVKAGVVMFLFFRDKERVDACAWGWRGRWSGRQNLRQAPWPVLSSQLPAQALCGAQSHDLRS